jgi:hypothetical protein
MEGWMILSVILFFFLILMSLFYGNCIIKNINPKYCTGSRGEFVVEVGKNQTIADDCDGKDCIFRVENLRGAVDKCNKDGCNVFYYENGTMNYVKDGGVKNSAGGGLYKRIGDIISEN